MTATDPRARQLAEAVHGLAREKATSLSAWGELPLSEREKVTAEARLWLRAAVDAGLVPPATDRATLRDRIAETMARADGWEWAAANFSSLSTPATDRYRRCADAVLAVLPDDGRATALEAMLTNVRAMHRKRTERHGSGCVQCGIVWPCPTYKALEEAVGARQPDTETQERTEEQVVRDHVTTVHLIGEQLAGIESWLWERLADVRAAGGAGGVADETADETGGARCPAKHGALGRICELPTGHPGLHTGSGANGGAVWDGDAP